MSTTRRNLGKPEPGKVYRLTAADAPCIAGGNTWAESEVLTYDLAHAAGTDAANRQMRAEGRAAWSAEDYDLAVTTMNNLCDRCHRELTPVEAVLGQPCTTCCKEQVRQARA